MLLVSLAATLPASAHRRDARPSFRFPLCGTHRRCRAPVSSPFLIDPTLPHVMASEVVSTPAPVAEPASAVDASSASAPAASSSSAADPADTGVVHHDLHVSHPPITPEVQEKLSAFRLTFAQDPVVSGADPAQAADFLTDQNLHRSGNTHKV